MTRVATILIPFLVALVMLLTACSDETDEAIACPDGLEPYTEFNFYFGLERGDGSQVTDDEWNSFLAEEITPRFPDGLTVFDARGQWLDTDANRLYREATNVLNILVPVERSNDAKQALDEITAVYVERFDQQVVFKTSAPACAGF